jgi:serine/threonine protein kinase
MQFRLLRCLAKAVAKHGGKFLFSLVPGGEAVYDIAADALEDYRRAREEGALRAELQALAQAPPEQVRQEAQAAVQAEAAGLPPDAQQTMATYLTQVPATIRRSLRRPSDPTGTTVPASLPFSRPEDLIPFLPSRPPRFKPGDRPLPGVDWVLDELIGVGGFGEVWKAYHAHLKSKPPVALKFCLDPSALPALRNEAGLLDRVIQHGRHPGVVALLQTYLSAAPPCLEYEYIEGGDLAALIQELHARGRMRPDTANGLMLHLAGIVASAHCANLPIVHGDLKPANVLVQRDESGKFKLRVIDYGIGGLAAARAARETKQQTRTRQELLTDAVRGAYTPLYASPQQMTRGQGEPADPRDDVHALGVIWLQLLTGDLGMMSVPPDWREQVEERGLNEGLVKLLASCIASRPGKRPANGLVLVEQLKAALVANERKPEAGQEREERRRRPPTEGETGQTRALPVSAYLNGEDSPTRDPVPQPGEARSATPQPKRSSRLVRSAPGHSLQGTPGRPGHMPRWVWVAGIGAVFALGVILLAVHLTRPKQGRHQANPEAPLAGADGAFNPTRTDPQVKGPADPDNKKGPKEGDGAAKEKREKPAESAAGTNPPPAGQQAERAPAASQERAELGSYVVAPKSAPTNLVRSPAGGDSWQRVAPGARLAGNDQLVSLPGYASELRLDSGVRLLLRGHVREFSTAPLQDYLAESAVVLHKPAAGVDADLTLRRGRLYISSGKEGPAVVRLRFEKEAWDLTLNEPGTEVGVDLLKQYTRDINYKEGEGPRAELYLCVLRGKAGVKMGEFHYSNLTGPPGPAVFLWDNIGPGAQGPKTLKTVPPIWSKDPPRTDLAKDMTLALEELSGRMAERKPLDMVLMEGLHQERQASRLLSVYCLGAIDEARKLVEILGDEDPAHYLDRNTAIFALRRWLSRGPEQGQRLYDEKTRSGLLRDMGYTDNDAVIVFDLLHDFNDKERHSPETFSLLAKYLRKDRVAIAELAWWQLRHLSRGVQLPQFNAALPAELRDKATAEVKKLVSEGKLPPPAAPSRPQAPAGREGDPAGAGGPTPAQPATTPPPRPGLSGPGVNGGS